MNEINFHFSLSKNKQFFISIVEGIKTRANRNSWSDASKHTNTHTNVAFGVSAATKRCSTVINCEYYLLMMLILNVLIHARREHFLNFSRARRVLRANSDLSYRWHASMLNILPAEWISFDWYYEWRKKWQRQPRAIVYLFIFSLIFCRRRVKWLMNLSRFFFLSLSLSRFAYIIARIE